MTLGMRKKNAFVLTAVFIITILSQSAGMVGNDLPVSSTFSSGFHLLHDSSMSRNEAEEFCSVITASQGGTVLYGGNIDLRSTQISDRELNAEFFPPYEGYGFVTLGRERYQKGYRTRTYRKRFAGMNEKGLAFAGSGVPPTSLTPHPERPFSGSYVDFLIKAMRECSNVASVIELAQTFDWGDSIDGQYHFADSTGDAVVISGGKDGELAFTRMEKEEGNLISTNFNRTAPESGNYPCWRYDTATEMLGEIGSKHDLTVDYFTSILDAIHVDGIWVNTAVSFIFDLDNGDIYLYYANQFEDAAKMNFEEKMAEINESSQLTASVFSAPLSESSESQIYFFFQLYSKETLEEARSEIQKHKRQGYLCMTAGIIAGAVIVSGLSLFLYRKRKNRQNWRNCGCPLTSQRLSLRK
jgi:hypothetical protein